MEQLVVQINQRHVGNSAGINRVRQTEQAEDRGAGGRRTRTLKANSAWAGRTRCRKSRVVLYDGGRIGEVKN